MRPLHPRLSTELWTLFLPGEGTLRLNSQINIVFDIRAQQLQQVYIMFYWVYIAIGICLHILSIMVYIDLHACLHTLTHGLNCICVDLFSYC